MSSEAKHTPGPWQYLGSPNRDYFDPTILSPDGKVIAAFRSYDFPDAAEHNGRLGAAAPELLEALRDLVEARALRDVRGQVAGWNGEHLPTPHAARHPAKLGATLPRTNCGAVYELDEAMQRARAVLAKATGAQK